MGLSHGWVAQWSGVITWMGSTVEWGYHMDGQHNGVGLSHGWVAQWSGVITCIGDGYVPGLFWPQDFSESNSLQPAKIIQLRL